MVFKRILLVVIWSLAFNSIIAQISNLKLFINASNSEDSICRQLILMNEKDTIENTYFVNELIKNYDSLSPGDYKIHIYDCNEQRDPLLIRYVMLQPNKTFQLNIDLNIEGWYYEIDTARTSDNTRAEFQLNLALSDPRWTEPKSLLNSMYSVGFNGYVWFPFRKHFGVLGGFGLGLAQYNFSKDTTFIGLTSNRKLSEFYNYFNAQGDVKFRFSFGSQKNQTHSKPRTTLDVGLVYYLPLVFRHVAWYENYHKVTNFYLHKFTDMRAHVDFGVSPVILFAEYKLFDCILGKYPDLPLYNFGIKLTFR